ncbi:MAG TPA: DUF6458 family protein [Acidimicrobiales bacterium]|jgi:hypothetical protein|nr:DUF6458 family protein [Acidimicrobiales bacterium]
MGIGVSVFLLAIGAILAFAVDVSTQGLDLNTVGVILMIVGVIGLLTSFMFWDRLGFGGAGSYRRTVVRDHDYVDDEPVVTRRGRTIRERRVVEDGF